MYCQTCGAEIQPGLNYCNRCGAQVNATATKEVLVPVDLTSPVRWVSATVGLTFLFGLITIFIALTGLASWGFNKDGVMFIAFFSLMMLGLLELSLLRPAPVFQRPHGPSAERHRTHPAHLQLRLPRAASEGLIDQDEAASRRANSV